MNPSAASASNTGINAPGGSVNRGPSVLFVALVVVGAVITAKLLFKAVKN